MMFKRVLMQWECSTQCYVLTACHLYLTGLPDGIKTNRFDSLLMWICIKLLVGVTAQLKYDTRPWARYTVHAGCLCRSYALAVQVHAPR